MISSPNLVTTLNRLRAPFNVGTPGQVAARAALADETHLRISVAATQHDRSKLTEALEAEGLRVAPSQANFVLVDLEQSGRAVYEAMLHDGVIVRAMPAPLENCIRVTIGKPQENERFLHSLRRVLKESRV